MCAATPWQVRTRDDHLSHHRTLPPLSPPRVPPYQLPAPATPQRHAMMFLIRPHCCIPQLLLLLAAAASCCHQLTSPLSPPLPPPTELRRRVGTRTRQAQDTYDGGTRRTACVLWCVVENWAHSCGIRAVCAWQGDVGGPPLPETERRQRGGNEEMRRESGARRFCSAARV